MNKFKDDFNNYLIFRYDLKNILTANISFFSNIKVLHEYIINYFDFINNKDFLESYDNYIKNNHTKNGHNMLFPKDYVFSFEYDNNMYELYRIDKNSNYVLFMFNIETQLIGYVKGFDNYNDAIEKMKNEYKTVYDDDNIFNDNNINLIIKDDKVFGMIFNI